MDEFRRADVFFIAGGVRHFEQRVDGVAAAAVDEGAGGAEQAAVERWIAHRDDLAGDEAVAPGLEKGGVKLAFAGGGRGCRGGLRNGRCEKRLTLRRSHDGGGETKHFSASELALRMPCVHRCSRIGLVFLSKTHCALRAWHRSPCGARARGCSSKTQGTWR
jgi:hypothetical protein